MSDLKDFLLGKIDDSTLGYMAPSDVMTPEQVVLITHDPSPMAHLLRGGSDVHQAVLALGKASIDRLSVPDPAAAGSAPPDVLAAMQRTLWIHCQVVGHCCELLAKAVNYPGTLDAFVAGLYHDIGKAFLNRYAYDSIQQALKVTTVKARALFTAEDEVFGFNHSYIGAKITARWKLPAHIVEAVQLHHAPEQAKLAPDLTEIVHLGNVLVNWVQMKMGLKSNFYPLRPYILEKFNLPVDQLRAIADEANAIVTGQAG